MTFKSKIKWILGVFVVFFLTIATNLLDRNSFLQIKDSVVAIYEDRLIADNLIFEISNSIHEKEVAIVSADTNFFPERNSELNIDISGFIKSFEDTRLTTKEQNVFEELKSNINDLKAAEIAFINSELHEIEVQLNHIFNIEENLFQLSEIQLKEGSRKASISKKALNTIELFTQIEIYLLVLLAVVISIMYKPKIEKEEE